MGIRWFALWTVTALLEVAGVLTDPDFVYPHQDQDFCVIGGFIYRGKLHEELTGKYLFGDNHSGRIWSIDPNQSEDNRQLLLRLPSGKSHSSLTSLFADDKGEIYFSNFASGDGPSIFRLVRKKPVAIPERLSELGIFTDLATLEVSSGFEPYSVNVPLWSDGLLKRRWMKVPSQTKINNSSTPWRFPAGTVLVKHFENPPELGTTHPPINVETRVLWVKADGQVYGASYVWSADQTDAFLQRERTAVQLTSWRQGLPGGVAYQIPSFRDCVVCHNRDNPVLGINPLQLVRGVEQSSAPSPLLDWSRRGLLTVALTDQDVDQSLRLASLSETSAPLEHRVRSYLHANCSHCHHPDGTHRTRFDARINTPLAEANIINAASLGLGATQVIVAPGDPEGSTLIERLLTDDHSLAMPYLGSKRIDDEAVAAIRQWILQLKQTHVANDRD